MNPQGVILGIEGTAWNLSAALFGDDLVSMHSDAYSPPHGGIHPREASQHHASMMKTILKQTLEDVNRDEIRGVAFSQGPGLGPCLRTVATAARAISVSLGVPLIGVNHCVAHIEIGRFSTGCKDPIVLYASGANTQVLGFLNGRYRIFGETLDIGLGNALDKYARSQGFLHPGGPKIEKLAKEGSFVELPYTVKGMDLAFSGLMSAAKDHSASLECVCNGLQETAFAMCVEVTERALAHAGKDEVLLVGGVGANRRLQEMLGQMCDERGATFHVPNMKYIGDNGAMIAYTGRIMLDAGASLPLQDSRVNSCFRSDDVDVVWRADDDHPRFRKAETEIGGIARGAEAIVSFCDDYVMKKRLSKGYRHPELDRKINAERTRAEARIISAARRHGVPTPIIREIDGDTIIMEKIKGDLLKTVISMENLYRAGISVGNLHNGGIIHGDLTTSNLVIRDDRCVLIDFGLGFASPELEDRGVDVHVLFQTLETSEKDAGCLKNAFIEGYGESFDLAGDVIEREHEIEMRGRYL